MKKLVTVPSFIKFRHIQAKLSRNHKKLRCIFTLKTKLNMYQTTIQENTLNFTLG